MFVAAEPREFSGLLRHAAQTSKLNWPVDFARRASWTGRTVLLVANGPGPALAGQALDALAERENIDALVSIGFCGGLSPSLAACDIFVATEVIGAGPASLPAGARRSYRSGKLLSIDRVVLTAAEKRELRQTGADAVEMEAAAVAERAQRWRVPFYAVRVVTDTADQSFPLDFNQLRDSQGHFDRVKILAAALRKPSALPALLKLNRRCGAAAEALGDFLAGTRF